MSNSLYAVLGVGRDDDDDQIERAYRDLAKTHHPDVSDDPDAGDRFKRMTFARDTLTDADERARYDRLGHEAYVREHAPPGLFEVSTADRAGESSTTDATDRTRAATDGGAVPDWWEGAPGDRVSEAATGAATTSVGRGVDGPSCSGGTTATGADFYSSEPDQVPRGSPETPGPAARVWSAICALGGWIVAHVLLIASALGVGWVAVAESVGGNMALPGLLFAFAVAGAALLASTLHVVTTLYT